MNYRKDHIKLLKVFAAALPKKPVLSVLELSKEAFSDIKVLKPDTDLNPDRACRNALRKPIAQNHIEIVDRGAYRLTTEGAAFCRKIDSYPVAPDSKVAEKAANKIEHKAKEPKVVKTVVDTSVKRRGRPPKNAAVIADAAPAKRRGRPPKAKPIEAVAAPQVKTESVAPVRKRNLIPGLKPKEEKVEAPVESTTTKASEGIAPQLGL